MPSPKTIHFLIAILSSFTEIMEYFKPDVILTQNGADAHYYDPLTHLSSTMRIYKEIPKLAHELAHNIVRVVGLQSVVAAMISGVSSLVLGP